jgi:hydroxysqualene dehydroxylase
VSAGRRVIVVGGGLAGIAAALDCAAAGASVTLVEVRRRLGGAAYSFERDGLRMDNGQHVFLRCCAAYRALLARLGSEQLTAVQARLEIPVLKPGCQPAVLRRGSLPAPAQLAGALARYPHLTTLERLGAARAALGLMRLDPGDETLDALTFGDWLARHGQGPRAVAALWDLIALPTLNLPAAQASLALAAFVFRTGLLSTSDAGDIGFHRATLGETIAAPARHALREAGVEVLLGWRAQRLVRTVSGLEVHGRGAAGPVDTVEGAGANPATPSPGDGDGLDGRSAEAVVVALPHERAATLLEPLLGQTADAWRGLGSSPIVNLHVVYDRRVCDEPFAAGVGTPVQYVFDRTDAAGAPAGCQYLAVSLSGAEREMAMSVDRLRERYLPALSELFPRARGATVERFLATREHAATFRAAPGVAALRPGPSTTVPGLALAGAWTATGWPATLEGAVLSGHAAAAAALQALGLATRPPVAWPEGGTGARARPSSVPIAAGSPGALAS